MVLQTNQFKYMSEKYSSAITVRLAQEVREQLKVIASKAQTSEGSIIRQAVSKFIKEYQ